MNQEAEILPQFEEHANESVIAVLNKSEIDQQISTAKKFPRSINQFRQECLQMLTLTEDIAADCIYALPRSGKTIEGPSARFAEIIVSAWGNCRAGARTVSEEGNFIVAQGVFHDLQRNVAINYEVKRRITDKKGKRFNDDMIGVTANAACSIALRNAVLKGIPKAFWQQLYDETRKVVMGDASTLANRRAKALAVLSKFGATEEMVLNLLDHKGVEDITLEDLVKMHGIASAIKNGDTTLEQVFESKKPDEKKKAPSKKANETKEQLISDEQPKKEEDQSDTKFTLDEVLEMIAQANNMDEISEAMSLTSDFSKEDQNKVIKASNDRSNELIKEK